MQLIDTHVHINFADFQADLEQVAQRWRDRGVVNLVHSCVEPGEFEQIQALSLQFPELYHAVGLHPLDVGQWTAESATQIRALAASASKLVAIGEMGLDFYKADNRKAQVQAFQAQLQIAYDLGLPVIIHCREAAVEMAELLRQFWATVGPVAGVMHCWGGTPEETTWFLALGFYISFSGTVTFKNAKPIHESARMVPSDRLLIETDCPFLSPVPKRGERRNEPANVYYVAEQIAKLRNVPLTKIAQETTTNACRLFKLPIPKEPPPTLKAPC
jgi:TatD DNase family protein